MKLNINKRQISGEMSFKKGIRHEKILGIKKGDILQIEQRLKRQSK